MALSGLSPSESAELCRYVDRLRDEKQFRVIKAMAESTVEGKKKFILNLRKKFLVQQAKLAEVQVQEEQNMESHLKRKQALNAASRVKMLNGGANKFHSFNAVVGPDGHVAMLTEDPKAEPYQQNRAMLMGHSPAGDPNLYAAAVYAQQAYVAPQQYEGQDYVANNGYDPRYYERQTSTGVSNQGASPAHQTDHQQQQNGGETWLQPSAPSANSEIDQDGMPRIADNQQQQAQQSQQPGANGQGMWDPYPRQDAAQLSPLSLQVSEFLF
ncbi:hypothetical protein AM588_10007184 [Phytophthora nicotianae]|uniref:Uncharacterized protein n=1 Tax=Phytophthora nicotianae TaxID=4792 RepID=A0A0W8DNH3_PHYNI|nr:hypothetical protein AM588_10007184 [Phytophthora nicotianae]